MLLYSVYGGSKLYNLVIETSDQDIRGVFVEPASIFFSLDTMDYYEDIPSDTVMYSLRKFIHLALKNNPNTLELLFAPPYKWITHEYEWRLIYYMRHKFLSQRAIKAYKGFILQGYDKYKAGAIQKPKQVSHIYRLAYNLAQLVSTQTFYPCLSGSERYTALAIKTGLLDKETTIRKIDDLLEYSFKRGTGHLPIEPDYDYINSIIIELQQRLLCA